MELVSANVDINNTSTFYLSKPSASPALTIIFVHGFPFNKTIWNRQLEALPDEVSGIAYDIRGFGESSTTHHFFSVDLFAKDLLAFIDSLQLTSCVLCGISMGGYIALRATELAPDKVKGLVLCDTNCVADSNEIKLKRFASVNQVLKGGKGDFTETFIENVFSGETLQKKPDIVEFLRKVITGTTEDTICATLLALAARTDTSNSLQKIEVPALIIRGEEDKIISMEQARQLAEGIGQSELRTIPESGHLPNLENVEVFNKSLNTFLNKHFLY